MVLTHLGDLVCPRTKLFFSFFFFSLVMAYMLPTLNFVEACGYYDDDDDDDEMTMTMTTKIVIVMITETGSFMMSIRNIENDSSDYEDDANSVFVAVVLAYQNNAKCFVVAYSCFHRVCPSKG